MSDPTQNDTPTDDTPTDEAPDDVAPGEPGDDEPVGEPEQTDNRPRPEDGEQDVDQSPEPAS